MTPMIKPMPTTCMAMSLEIPNILQAIGMRSSEPPATPEEPQAAPDVPFTVKVSISDLNIRKGPGTDYAKTGKFTGKGVFTIVEVQSGQGASAGWGRLKSGAGWISLDYAVKTE